MPRVLIAVDGSELARYAAKQAIGLFRSGSDVTIVTVVAAPVVLVPPPGTVVGPADLPSSETTQALVPDGEATVEEVARALRLPDGRTRVLSGQPGPELCRLAAEEGADVLVVGSHGTGVLRRVLLGSVSDHVVRHSPCPVLVVRQRGGSTASDA